jgi:hypothetical protein
MSSRFSELEIKFYIFKLNNILVKNSGSQPFPTMKYSITYVVSRQTICSTFDGFVNNTSVSQSIV